LKEKAGTIQLTLPHGRDEKTKRVPAPSKLHLLRQFGHLASQPRVFPKEADELPGRRCFAAVDTTPPENWKGHCLNMSFTSSFWILLLGFETPVRPR